METSSKLLVHSFNKYLLITYCVPVTIFIFMVSVMNKTSDTEQRDSVHTCPVETDSAFRVDHTFNTLWGNKRNMFYEGWEVVIFAVN